jgi:hypothetical protein
MQRTLEFSDPAYARVADVPRLKGPGRTHMVEEGPDGWDTVCNNWTAKRWQERVTEFVRPEEFVADSCTNCYRATTSRVAA